MDAAAVGSAAARVSMSGTPPGGRRVSLRPRNNVDADDLLDHWGHRHSGLVSARLSQVPEPGDDAADLRALLEAARKKGSVPVAPDLRDEDTVTVLGQRRGVAYGRWSGGPADTLAIEFDLRHATSEMRNDRSFEAALERAGKAWSQRIEDTWEEWERAAGESKGRLIGDYGAQGREILVGPGGETSAALVVYVTGIELGETTTGWGGYRNRRPGGSWEPHTGAVAFDNDYLEEAGEASLFRTMVHEIGHVLGAWLGEDTGLRPDSFTDREAGTWIGPNVVAVHGGPAPFQDNDDGRGWYDGERNPDAGSFDFGHSGVCASVMAYCAHNAAIPAFQPAEIDFAFLADLGLGTRQATDRPETYGLAGWMDHSAFTLSVSRELKVSLADPQPRYTIGGGRWQSLDTVDLLWVEADAFGDPSTADLARSFPLAGTVRYSGGLIGTAVELPGFPPVHGDANLWIALDSLNGKASFTSLRTSFKGARYLFGGGSLHYPIAMDGNAIGDAAPGVSLTADFYGPRHEEVAGTLDDSRVGLVASFGAKYDGRPSRPDVIVGADHVRGMKRQDGFGETANGWHSLRCGAGSGCEGKFEWWKAENDWYDVSARGDRTGRERVLDWTAGWGEWMSEDMFGDHGGIRVARRHARTTDGARGRYQADGYYGAMEHAAFGTGFYSYHDWERQDGEVWDFDITGTGFQGDLIVGNAPGGRGGLDRRTGGWSAFSPGSRPARTRSCKAARGYRCRSSAARSTSASPV